MEKKFWYQSPYDKIGKLTGPFELDTITSSATEVICLGEKKPVITKKGLFNIPVYPGDCVFKAKLTVRSMLGNTYPFESCYFDKETYNEATKHLKLNKIL